MTNTKTSWAQRGKEAQQAIQTAPSSAYVGRGKPLTGGREPFVAYYQFKVTPKSSPLAREYTKGMEIVGTFEGTYPDEKFGKLKHRIRTSEGLVSLDTAAQLQKGLAKATQGQTKVVIVYNGKQLIEKGQYAGKEAHQFYVGDITEEQTGT